MSMPIPSGLANLPVIEVRRSTDIPPTNPTTGINGVTPMDPRQMLQMAEPVVTAEQSGLARESLQRNFQENLNKQLNSFLLFDNLVFRADCNNRNQQIPLGF